MKTRFKKGFTLIEIMVVVIILATLASTVIITMSKKPEEAKVTKAKSDIGTFETVLETFRLEMGRYPTEEEGLQALVKEPESEDADRWKGPYIKRVIKDPWGNPYVYINPGYYNPEGFDLFSYGADGLEGGEDFDTDIGNWETEEYEEE